MSDMDTFMHAERIQESGDNYHARNASSGASGAYQFTWGTWLYALGLAGLRRPPYNYESANNAPPSVQDAAARALMSLYYNEFGHSFYNVAEAWYGGPGAVGHPTEGGGPGYPNVGQYASDVMAIYKRLGGSGSTGSGVTPGPAPAGVDSTLRREFDWAEQLYRVALANNIQWIDYNNQLHYQGKPPIAV